MSDTLDAIIALAANYSPKSAALSPESVAVLLFGLSVIKNKHIWLDTRKNPLDEVTDSQWDQIVELIEDAEAEVMAADVGEIFPFITADPPENCLLCDGTTYARSDYPELYAALDPAFVVDADNFVVPDLRARVPVGAGSGTGLSTYAVNQTGGEESHALTGSENGPHNHALFEITFLALTGEEPVLAPFITSGAHVTDSDGSGTAHENRPPFVALNWAVRAI